MIHFLQHLPNARVAEEVIANAEQVRRDERYLLHLPQLWDRPAKG